MKKLDYLKAMVEWGEEARHAWQEELAAGERDNNVLERFKLEDNSKFKVGSGEHRYIVEINVL